MQMLLGANPSVRNSRQFRKHMISHFHSATILFHDAHKYSICHENEI